MSLLFFPTKIILPPCAQGLLRLAVEACVVYDDWLYLLAKLQISVDFSAGFGRNMTEEVANFQFFCLRCQKVVEKFGSLLAYSYLCIVKGGTK